MPLWQSGCSVKVALPAEGGQRQLRLLALPAGPRTRLLDFLALLEDRCGQCLAGSITYRDAEGDVLTASSDAELQAALAAGVERFEVALAPEQPEGWEILESPVHAGQKTDWATEVRFWLNGEEEVVSNPHPSIRLLDWLRESKGLTGTHKGCGEGGCGICTVSLAYRDPGSGELKQAPVNSCLRRLCSMDGCHVVTTEGLGCQQKGFHGLQKAIAQGNGSQCGFCTPGWVMSMYSLLEQSKEPPTREGVERHFDGNLCRCTGYRPILRAFGAFAKGGERCGGQGGGVPHPAGTLAHEPRPLHFQDPQTGEEWFRPLSMEQFLEAAVARAKNKRLQLLRASTADGVAKYYEQQWHQVAAGTVFVDVSQLPELQGLQMTKEGMRVGAAVAIEELIAGLQENCKESPSFSALAEHMRRIASVPIRSVASWVGNVMFTRKHPGFPSDMVTILAAAGALFEVMLPFSLCERRQMGIQELLDFQGDVLVLSAQIPKTAPGAVFQTFKAAPRAVFAHAYVNFAACLEMDSKGKVGDSRIFLGGACEGLLRASNTEAALRGRALDQAALDRALAALRAEIAARPGGGELSSERYRGDLAMGFLYKTFLAASAKLPPRFASAVQPFIPMAARPVSTGTESFGTDPSASPVGQYVPKRAALVQASGEALFPSDYGGRTALFAQFVFSSAARAKLVALDPTEALQMPGVVDFVAAPAVPGVNCVNSATGGECLKEKIFFEVGDVVPCVGAVLGLVVASSWQQAREAARAVRQQFAAAGPVVRNAEEAARLRRTLPGGHGGVVHRARCQRPELAAGVDVGPGASQGMQTAKGLFRTGGQSHFYMETQAVCVTPHDGGQWEVVCSDQDANLTQRNLAAVLNTPLHNINVKVPRAGGGFGGKLSRQLMAACAVAVAAHKLRRPVRLQNERSDDMQIVGGREPIDFDYEVTFDATGRVDSMNLAMTVDPGWLYGDSQGSISMAVGWSDNCYQYKSFKVTTKAAITDKPTGTFMRAPGCMQSVLAAEVVMEHIAKTVGRPLEEVQQLNFYRPEEKPTTPFGDHIGQGNYNWTIPILWEQIQKSAEYAKRQAEVEGYNAASRWRKRGLALSPAKYVMDTSGGGYSSGALVNVYEDGTVLVSSGGSEVGQGLTTKVSLCVAEALGAPLEKVHVGPRETSKVPDNTPTGGSGTSECSSEAAILACEKLLPLLAPYRKSGEKWEEAVAAACKDKVGLMASAWFSGPKNGANANTYATYGTAVSEVSVDVLTGEVRVERVDVLMDLGNQLDAAVDIGQVQGGFVIALGYLLTEELKVDAKGTQLHLGTWDYKIPSAYDIPLEFNVALLEDSPNPAGVKGSKASAEPSMCLLPSVYLAVKQALYAARREVGLEDGWFMLDTPLTPEAVRAAVAVPLSQLDLPQ